MRSTNDNVKYDNKNFCHICKGKNHIVVKDYVVMTICEAETTCESCGHIDYWALGWYQSRINKNEDDMCTENREIKVTSSFIRGYKTQESDKPFMIFITIIMKTGKMWKYEIPGDLLRRFIDPSSSKGSIYAKDIKKFPSEYLGKEEVFYHVGQRFNHVSLGVFILVHMYSHKCYLIRDDFNGSFSCGVYVNDLDRITKDELTKMVSGNSQQITLIEEN